MMRMLEAGGIPPYYDNSKPVSWTNNGIDYLNYNVILRETNKINDLKAGDGSWLKDCYGKTIKILTPISIALNRPSAIPPRNNRYKFIWCERKTKHIIKSLLKYGKRAGIDSPPEDILYLNAREARRKGKFLLKNYPDADLIEIKFEDVLKKPVAVCDRIERFLDTKLDKKAMASVVVKRPSSCMPYMMEEHLYINN